MQVLSEDLSTKTHSTIWQNFLNFWKLAAKDNFEDEMNLLAKLKHEFINVDQDEAIDDHEPFVLTGEI